MTNLEIIDGMIKLLHDPNHWTKHVSARDAHGRPTYATDPEAVCRCEWGALRHVAGNEDVEPLVTVLHRTAPHLDFISFNDHVETTHADVMAHLHRAREMVL